MGGSGRVVRTGPECAEARGAAASQLLLLMKEPQSRLLDAV